MEKLLSEKEIEQIYGISRRWLQKMRWVGGGPIFLKIGKSVRYRVSDFEAYLEAQKRTSTSDQGQGGVKWPA